MMAKIRVVAVSGEIVSETETNMNRKKSRKWLDGHIAYNLSKGHGVQMWNAEFEEPGK